MTVSTTFGYNQREDRVWISCDAWPQRVWITRRVLRGMMQAVIGVLESDVAADPEALGRPAAERAAAAHDASINRPQPGERTRLLQTGRESASDPALQSAVLCTQFTLLATGTQTEMVLLTPSGQRRLRLSRVDLHRWLHGLQMVLKSTGWADWPSPPEWLTRSYLPPALRSMLESASSAAGLDLEHDSGDPDELAEPPRAPRGD